MKKKLLDEVGAAVEENLLCATVSKQWTLRWFSLLVRPPAGLISFSPSGMKCEINSYGHSVLCKRLILSH